MSQGLPRRPSHFGRWHGRRPLAFSHGRWQELQFFKLNKWVLSLDMKTKVVQNVQRINISNLTHSWFPPVVKWHLTFLAGNQLYDPFTHRGGRGWSWGPKRNSFPFSMLDGLRLCSTNELSKYLDVILSFLRPPHILHLVWAGEPGDPLYPADGANVPFKPYLSAQDEVQVVRRDGGGSPVVQAGDCRNSASFIY